MGADAGFDRLSLRKYDIIDFTYMNEFFRIRFIVVILALAVGAVALFSNSARAQQVTVLAQTDRQSVPSNQTLNFTVTISGASNTSQPALPAMDGFQVRGSRRATQVATTNGRTAIETSFTFTLQPTKEGQFTIPPVTLVADGATYTTEPITVEVVPPTAPGGGAGNGQSGSIPNATAGNEIFIEAEVDNPAPHLGEQITYNFRFYRSINIGQVDYGAPAFEGFWNQQEGDQADSSAEVDGRLYQVIELKTILIPTIVGDQIIEPARLTISRGFLQPSITLETSPVPVNVQPLPSPAPGGFSGAVGQFSLAINLQTESGESGEQLVVEVDEPVTLRATLEGAGNFQTMPEMTLPTIPDWRAFDSTSSTDSQVMNGMLVGRRTVEQLIVPSQPGQYVLPSAEFAYFDPATNQYETLSTESIQITVEGEVDAAANTQPAPLTAANSGSSAVERVDADIRHIKAVPASLDDVGSPFAQGPLFWLLWLVPLLLIGGDWMQQRRQQAINADPVAARRSRALREAQRQIKEAGTSQTDIYSSLRDIITQYLSSRVNHSVSGLTQRELTQLLDDHGIATELAQQTQDLLALSDMGQYAPMSGGQLSADEPLSQAEELLQQLEQEFATHEANQGGGKLTTIGQSGTSALLLFLLLLWALLLPKTTLATASQSFQSIPVGQSSEQTMETAMEVGNQLYEAAQYAEAAIAYEELVSQGIVDASLLFNLGNAYFKQGDIGRAILSYERAALRAPRDSDLRANLALAETLLTDQYDAQQGSMLAQLAQLSARWLSEWELRTVGLLLWFLVAILWILYRRGRAKNPANESPLTYPFIGAVILLLLVMGLWATRGYTESTRSQAVILAQEVAVLSGPGEQYITEFTLHSGSKVSVLESRGQWRRLTLPGDELQGWVPMEAVGMIVE